MATKPRAHAELHAHAIVRPGQVGQRPCRVPVEALRREGAERARRSGLGRLHGDCDLRLGVIDLTRLEAQRGRIG
jgi:hypothetical protein